MDISQVRNVSSRILFQPYTLNVLYITRKISLLSTLNEQPLKLGHTVDEEGDPRGDIHTYRMALWSAHFGGYDEVFQNPNSDECREKGKNI